MAEDVVFSPMRGVPVTLQAAASVDETAGLVLAIPASFVHHKIYIIGGTGVSSGAVQAESANTSDYAGTWAQIGGGPISVVADTVLQLDFIGVYNFIRCRVSTTIGGGTVTVKYEGAP